MKKLNRLATVAITIACLFLVGGSACGQNNESLDKAVEWLVAQQDESGAFKSKHYGAMKQGAAMTSLALYSMSMTSDECRKNHKDAIEKAFQFLMPGTQARGRVANPDGSLDHPVYSTAMLLVAADRLDFEIDAELMTQLLDFLIRSQCVEGRGFNPANPNYGGWDVIGPDVMPGKTAGTNVSMTRFVLEAFSYAVPVNVKPTLVLDEKIIARVKESRQRAVDWLERLHKNSSDGGFHFSAQPGSALNKSRSDDDSPKSYGAATCDGLLAMHFGGDTSSESWKSTKAWIKTRTSPGEIGGFENQKESGWPKALKFYYLQSLARTMEFISASEPMFEKEAVSISAEINSLLKMAQREDGRFENQSALMRENDPLIATSFAIIAMSAEPKMSERQLSQ